MFDNEDEFTEAVKKLGIDTRPDSRHREALREQMLAAFERNANGQNRSVMSGRFFRSRRLIMKDMSTTLKLEIIFLMQG